MKKLLVILLALMLTLGAFSALAEELELELGQAEEFETELWTNDMAAGAAVMPAEAGVGIAIDAANFPDETLREYVRAGFDEDGDGCLSDAEAGAVTGIYVGSDDSSTRGACASVKGIELFPNLKELFVQWTSIETLDVSGNPRLEVLACPGNGLTALDVSKNPALKELICWDNPLTALDVTQNPNLTVLECGTCQLTALDVSKNPGLEKLTCEENQLKQLDVTVCPKLTTLWCYDNQLTALDLSKNTQIQSLWCNGNPIAKLDIRSEKLRKLIRGAGAAVDTDAVCWEGAEGSDISLHTPICARIVSGSATLASFGVWFDAEHFPDATLRDYVRAGFDLNGDGFLSDAEAAEVTGIYVGPDDDSTRGKCASVAGIEYFPNLKELFVQRSKIKSLDVSKNTRLEVLVCCENQLSKLNVSKNKALKSLVCWGTLITKLDVSKNTRLEELDFGECKLTKINLSKNTALRSLRCGTNKLTKLDVSKCTKLVELWCDGNKLKALDVTGNRALTDLRVGGNALKALDVSKCTKLKMLDASDNKLSKLDVSKNGKLEALYCNCSGMEKFDIAKLPAKLRKLARKNKFKVEDGAVSIIPAEDKGLIFSEATTLVDGKKVVYKAK